MLASIDLRGNEGLLVKVDAGGISGSWRAARLSPSTRSRSPIKGVSTNTDNAVPPLATARYACSASFRELYTATTH